MSDAKFRALVVEEGADRQFIRQITDKSISDLPKGDVLIKVHFSSLNYKDALSASGNKGVTRSYPHTPGIDAAGEVAESGSDQFKVGSRVLVTGYDLGMNTSGGFGQYIRVPAEWVVPLPEGLSLQESMIYGTAGFTAGIGVHKLIQAGLTPASGEILVTGASGGVGSLAVAMMAHLGYTVVAASGKQDAAELLRQLGAAKVIGRDETLDRSGRPLLSQQWAGAIETVGGEVLTYVLRSTKTHGMVACCGNVGGASLELTVYPFILRGISLSGIDSATTPMPLRREIWQNMAGPWRSSQMDALSSLVPLDGLNEQIDLILSSQQIGRRVIDMRD